MPIPALFWHSNPTVRLQAFHKFESQLHFMLHWHLKMDFLVGENDILLEEVTQDNLNPTLSKKQLAPFTQGNSLYPSDIQCLHSLSFLYPLPLVTLVIHRNIFYTYIRWYSTSSQKQWLCFGHTQYSSNHFLRHEDKPHAPALMLEAQYLHRQCQYLWSRCFTVVWSRKAFEEKFYKGSSSERLLSSHTEKRYQPGLLGEVFHL